MLLRAAFTALLVVLPLEYSLAGKLEEAELLFHDEAYEAAIPLYLEALANPSYSARQKAEINYGLGTAYLLKRDNAKAVKYFQAARSLMPGIHDRRIFKINSTYMEPQIKMGDIIIVDPGYFQHKPVRRYDVVAFLHPKMEKYMYVMRIIGMPRERIEIKDKQVFINDTELSEPFPVIADKNASPFFYDNLAPIEIPENTYFLMADNRDNSLDSRDFGVVDQRLIRGKALAIYGIAIEDGTKKGISMDRAGILIK